MTEEQEAMAIADMIASGARPYMALLAVAETLDAALADALREAMLENETLLEMARQVNEEAYDCFDATIVSVTMNVPIERAFSILLEGTL